MTLEKSQALGAAAVMVAVLALTFYAGTLCSGTRELPAKTTQFRLGPLSVTRTTTTT